MTLGFQARDLAGDNKKSLVQARKACAHMVCPALLVPLRQPLNCSAAPRHAGGLQG